MNISRDALSRVVSATRRVHNISGVIATLTNATSENLADHACGELADALFLISGERGSDDFNCSRTYNLLFSSCLSNEEVADELIRMADANKPKQPAPILMTQEEYDALYGTPEGEWPI